MAEGIKTVGCLEAILASEESVDDACNVLRAIHNTYSADRSMEDHSANVECPLRGCGVERAIDFSPAENDDPNAYYQAFEEDDLAPACARDLALQPHKRWNWDGPFLDPTNDPDYTPPATPPTGGLAA